MYACVILSSIINFIEKKHK